MGEVKDAVKGSGSKKSKPTPAAEASHGNLVQRTDAIIEELGELIQQKDEDAVNEGKSKQPENIEKAARLRAAASLFRAAKVLLEDY